MLNRATETPHSIHRYAPLVQQRGGHVIVECQPPLTRLLRSVAGINQPVPQGDLLPTFDTHLPLLSLPRVFHTRLDNIPATVPYLELPMDPRDTLDISIKTAPKQDAGWYRVARPRNPQ